MSPPQPEWQRLPNRRVFVPSGIRCNKIPAKRFSLTASRNNVGNSNAGSRSSFTRGGSQLALRNLSVLVLINGRRAASSGVNALRGTDFVDVNQIPVAAIDRIEVLTDGASAVYGSDAVGGVINFILKSNYQGFEVGGRYGTDDRGKYTERSGYFLAGIAKEGVSLTVTGSWVKTTPVMLGDRPFSRVITGQTSVIPGVVSSGAAVLSINLNSPSQTNPTGASATATTLAQLIANGTYTGTTASAVSAGFNISPYVTLLIGQEQKSSAVNGSAEIFGQKLVAFGSLLLSEAKSTTQFLPAQVTLSEPAKAPYNPLTVAFPGVAFALLANPRINVDDTRSNHMVAGLRSQLTPNWSAEAAYTYSLSRIREEEQNVLYAPNLTRAIAGGYDANGNAVVGGRYSRVVTGYSESGSFVIQPALDPFARTPSDVSLANVLGTGYIYARNLMTAVDLKVVGSPWELPAGKIGFAAGAQYRKEHLSAAPDANSNTDGPTAQFWTGGVFYTPFQKDRKIDAYFAEVRVPVTSSSWNFPAVHALDLTAAYRVEKYSDAGRSTVPKFGVRWLPIDDEQLTFRYSYSESFVAPTLFQLYAPTTLSLSQPAVLVQLFGVGGQTHSLAAGNPNLKPTTETSRSFGVAVSPKAIPGLTVSVDYLHALQLNFPLGTGLSNIFSSVDQFGPASPYANQVSFNNYPGQAGAVPITAAGQLGSYLRGGGNSLNIYSSDLIINQSGAKFDSIDVSLAYLFPATSVGRFKFTTVGTLLPTYKFKSLPAQPYYEYAGFVTSGGTGFQGTMPKYRFYSVFEWRHGSWDANIANTYIPPVTDIGGGGATFATSTTLKPIPVTRYFSWDCQVGYTVNRDTAANWLHILRGAEFRAGVTDVFNRMPPPTPQSFVPIGVDSGTYSAIGRRFYVSSSLKF